MHAGEAMHDKPCYDVTPFTNVVHFFAPMEFYGVYTSLNKIDMRVKM